MRWVYLVTAPNELVAEMWRDLLVQAGIPALVEAGGRASFLGNALTPLRIMVADERREEAREVLEGYLTPAEPTDEDA